MTAVHLQILARLLSMKGRPPGGWKPDSGVLSERLLGHVISNCYPKIKRRFGNKTLSKPYLKSLKQVSTFDVDISKLDETSRGVEHDRLFLVRFFLETSLKFQKKYPAISKQAERKGDAGFQLYTKDTSADFHALLIFLLEGFKNTLEKLSKMRAAQKDSTPCSREFDKTVQLITTYGYALLRLSHGAALWMHLKTIAPLLQSNLEKLYFQAKTPAPDGEQEHEELDADLKAVQFSVGDAVENPLWQSYIDWLRLLMTHFDAVEVLVTFFTVPSCPYETVSVHIFSVQHGGKKLLPWRQLLQDSTIFPTQTIRNPLSKQPVPQTSNKTMLEFLDSINDSDYQQAKRFIASWNECNLSSINANLEKLKTSKLPGWAESSMRLLHKLKGLESLPKMDTKLHLEITEDFRAIEDSYCFVAALISTSTDSDFGGTMHCEACLASLLFGAAPHVSKDLLEQIKVHYISSSFLSPESHFL